MPIDEDGALTPPVLPLATDTKAAWIMFHDAIESELRSGGELYDVRDVASKTADNVARIAALFQIFEHGAGGAIGSEAFEGASRTAAWHLHEARRFYGELALPEEQANAARLESWLLDYCRREKTNIVPRREVQRNVTPGHLRRKAALDNALAELVEAGKVQLIQNGRRKEIHINPALLKGAGNDPIRTDQKGRIRRHDDSDTRDTPTGCPGNCHASRNCRCRRAAGTIS